MITLRKRDLDYAIKMHPTIFTVEHTPVVDKMTGKKAASVLFGPFTGFLSEYKVTRAYPVNDEKGDVVVHPYVLLCQDIPNADAIFILNAFVRVQNRRYRIESPLVDTVSGIVTVGLGRRE